MTSAKDLIRWLWDEFWWDLSKLTKHPENIGKQESIGNNLENFNHDYLKAHAMGKV